MELHYPGPLILREVSGAMRTRDASWRGGFCDCAQNDRLLSRAEPPQLVILREVAGSTRTKASSACAVSIGTCAD